MPKFLFSYRLPEDYQRSAETAKAWAALFESLGTSLIDRGRVLAARAMGNLDADTRLGGYSVVTAEDLDGAAALAEGMSRSQGGRRRGGRHRPRVHGSRTRAMTGSANIVLP